MASNAAETVIGAVVLAVAGGFLVYAANTADVSLGGGGYDLKAEFPTVTGLDVGSTIQIGGVKVGTVKSIDLDKERYYPIVTMAIDADVKIPEDSSAKISSEGLLGGNFIDVTPGASDIALLTNEQILDTQGSIDFLGLIAKAVQGLGGD